MRRETRGVLFALASAGCFGLVNVAGRGLDVHPVLAGALAYLVAGVALAPFLLSARIQRRDRGRVLLIGVVGGALAPSLLFLGLRTTPAGDASLLLTLEMVFTALLAALFLGERTRGRPLLGLGVLFLASLLVAASEAGAPAPDGPDLPGMLLVAGAALAWGVDNTLSARLTGIYPPHHLVALKGLVGGACALAAAFLLDAPPRLGWADAGRVLFIGLVGVAASVILFYHALQRIGATRTSALFLPLSALAGVAGAALLLAEPLRASHAAALALVALGAWLLLRRADEKEERPLEPP